MREFDQIRLVDTLIYDFDGTLIDSASIVISLLNEIRLEMGKIPIDSECLVPWISMGGEEMIQRALDLEDLGSIQRYLKLFRMRYMEMPTPKNLIYPGVKETLETLLLDGFLLGICTNKPRVLVEKIIKEIGIEQYFSAIQAGGDSPEKKPHPTTLMGCLKQLSSSVNRSLLIGDSSIDQRLADACGVGFVFFRKGYDDGVDSKSAFKTISTHEEMIKVVQKAAG